MDNNRNIFENQDTALTDPYIRLIHRKTKLVVKASTWLPTVGVSYEDSAIVLTKDTGIVGWPITIDTRLPAGEYDLVLYDNASPADTDVAVDHGHLSWTGRDIIGSLARK